MLSLRYIANTPRLVGFHSQSFYRGPPLRDYLNWRFKIVVPTTAFIVNLRDVTIYSEHKQ